MSLDREQIESRLSEENGGTPDLSGLDLTGADLSRLDLRGVNLSRADLSAADLRWAVLEGADLHSSVLRRADARWAVMRGANLRQADLGRANLGWADVTGADLTGAQLEGASLDDVDMASAILPQPARGSRGAFARSRSAAMSTGEAIPVPMGSPSSWRLSLPGSLSLPRITPTTVALALLTLFALVQSWGWLYRRSYFIGGWELDLPGLVTVGQGANFTAGLTKVIPLTIKAMLSAPLALLAFAILIGLVALPVALLWFFGERVLADIVRPQARPFVVGGLFVAYTVIFLLLIIPGALDILRWVTANGLPGDRSLRTVGQLFSVGGLITKAVVLLTLAGCALLVWIGWRWLSNRIAEGEVPLSWRMRYPALNSAAVYARRAPVFANNAPLSEDERRQGLWTLVGVVLLLGTLLTGAGRVQAFNDMCDGGDLPRMQLYHGDPPPNVINATLCQRMLVETADAFYVFFPGQTNETIAGDIASRVPNLREVEKSDELQTKLATGETSDCPTCGDGPSGNELFVVYPNEQRVEGPVYDQAGNLITLDLKPGPDVIDSIRVDETTLITRDGSPTTLEAVEAGLTVVAYGSLDLTQANLIAAREINILSPPTYAAGELPPGELQIGLSDPWNPLFEGQGWQPGNTLEIRLVQDDGQPIDPKDPGGNQLASVTADELGGFAVPFPMTAQVPTGPGYKIVVVDPETGQVQVGDWLPEPLPTQTPVPTVPTAAPTREATRTPRPAPDDPDDPDDPGAATATATGEAAETPEPRATNTALPTPGNLPPSIAPPFSDCEPDEYEPDNARGQQTVLYPTTSGDMETQTHNFCPKSDIDLYMFQVKAGRHYRVRTLNLASGVDTVMAVGDLSPGTGCQPWHPSFGCWSDDRNATSLDSEIIFQAVANDLVIVTVDNRGLRSGEEATYDIGVEQYVPGDDPEQTRTPTATATATEAVLPLRDIYDNYASNNTCRTASEDALNACSTIRATLGSASDEDYYLTVELQPYRTEDGRQGRYEFKLEPSNDRDYDMDVGPVSGTGSRRSCGRSVYIEQRDGDRDEVLVVEVSEPTTFYVRVYPRPGSKDFDPYEFYRLTLCFPQGYQPSQVEPTATPTLEPTEAPTSTWTSTPTPSVTPTAPGLVLPSTSTPTSTPTLTPGTP